jgi:hypothetical protein
VDYGGNAPVLTRLTNVDAGTPTPPHGIDPTCKNKSPLHFVPWLPRARSHSGWQRLLLICRRRLPTGHSPCGFLEPRFSPIIGHAPSYPPTFRSTSTNGVGPWLLPRLRAGKHLSGTAIDFDHARTEFDSAWRIFSTKRTEADYQAWHDQRD